MVNWISQTRFPRYKECTGSHLRLYTNCKPLPTAYWPSKSTCHHLRTEKVPFLWKLWAFFLWWFGLHKFWSYLALRTYKKQKYKKISCITYFGFSKSLKDLQDLSFSTMTGSFVVYCLSASCDHSYLFLKSCILLNRYFSFGMSTKSSF